MNAEKYERTGSHVAGKDVLCAFGGSRKLRLLW